MFYCKWRYNFLMLSVHGSYPYLRFFVTFEQMISRRRAVLKFVVPYGSLVSYVCLVFKGNLINTVASVQK